MGYPTGGQMDDLIRQLNGRDLSMRLDAATRIGQAVRDGKLQRRVLQEVNNHVHTSFSFSPYEPSAAAFEAWRAGLGIVGSIDHDSIAAAQEMLEASRRIGIASTVGFEVRCSFHDTPFATRKINNPDSEGIVYMCVHGVPRKAIREAGRFLEPIRNIRNERNRAQVALLNELLNDSSLESLDFDRDVMPLSRFEEGGSVTERHILHALALRIMDTVGRGTPVVDFLQRKLGIPVEGRIGSLLSDPQNAHYGYDLLGLLKGNFLPRFFMQPSREETVDVRDVVTFGLSIGAIPAYAYLGDIEQSVTGDKKAERFEDAYLDELVAYLAELGYPAITYMPPRNSVAQMRRLQTLCKRHGLMEISGVDINSSRQSFNCPELLAPDCIHLVDSAWALVAHEKLTDYRDQWSLFSKDNPLADRTLEERIALYAKLGKAMDPFEPESIVALAKRELQ